MPERRTLKAPSTRVGRAARAAMTVPLVLLVVAANAAAQTGPAMSDRDCPGPGCPPAALARESADYSAEDIRDFFEHSRGAAGRAICIGDASACAETLRGPEPASEAVDILVTFELGSDRLTAQARKNLAVLADALQSDALRENRFEIAGHTDARGAADYNARLSEARARAVAQYLTELGVDAERLRAVGYGEERPRVEDQFAAINRRVEISLLGGWPRPASAGAAASEASTDAESSGGGGDDSR